MHELHLVAVVCIACNPYVICKISYIIKTSPVFISGRSVILIVRVEVWSSANAACTQMLSICSCLDSKEL